MNKNQVIESLVEMVRNGEISQSEIMQAYSIGSGKSVESKFAKFTISQVLSTIGSLIVCIGIIVLVFQHWDDLSSMLRIFITLGTAVAAYVVAVLFSRYPNLKTTTLVTFGISMTLLPLGMMVAIHELAGGTTTLSAQIVTSLIGVAVAFASFLVYKKNLFLAFSIAFGTWLYYVSIIKLLDSNVIFNNFNLFAYMTIAAGLAYIFIGFAFSNSSERRELTPSLYKLGLVAVLAAALSIGGIWDFLYVFIVFGAILLSVYLKNKTFLWLGGIFLMAYIIKITSKYFYQNLGWPLSLVLAGMALIAVGYFTHYIGRKYITKNEPVRS